VLGAIDVLLDGMYMVLYIFGYPLLLCMEPVILFFALDFCCWIIIIALFWFDHVESFRRRMNVSFSCERLEQPITN
jgi:hypothetical protein